MKKKRHSLETIMRILRQAETEKSITAVCHEYVITEQTLYRWRRKYDNMGLLNLGCERYGAPKCIRSDNGPEFVATAV
jgi:transposase-like protein